MLAAKRKKAKAKPERVTSSSSRSKTPSVTSERTGPPKIGDPDWKPTLATTEPSDQVDTRSHTLPVVVLTRVYMLPE